LRIYVRKKRDVRAKEGQKRRLQPGTRDEGKGKRERLDKGRRVAGYVKGTALGGGGEG
jgi:hypothetical protein